MPKHARIRYVISSITTIIPYLIAFLFNQSFIANLFSLVLFAVTIYLLKIPVRILRTAFKVSDTEDIMIGLKNRRWLWWWLSPSMFGATSYLYFILVKNDILVFTNIGYPYLKSALIVIFWWMITLTSFTFLYQRCWEEYLRNVLHIRDDAIRKANISIVRWRRAQDFLVNRLGVVDFQTYERVTVSYVFALGMVASLTVVFFLGGDVMIDITMLIITLYALLFNPTSRFGKFQELFYKRMLSDFREAHKSSFMISILLLLVFVGNDIVFLERMQVIPFLVKVISLFIALSLFFIKRELTRITKVLPYLASSWIFLTYFFSTHNLTSALMFCLLPLTWYFLFSALQSGIKDVRRSTVGKMIAYVALFAAASFTSSILFLIETGSLLSIAFLVFAQFLVVSLCDKIIESRKDLVHRKFKDTILRQETQVSIVSAIGLAVLIIAYFYFFFLRDLSIIRDLYIVEMIPIVFLKLSIPIISLPFVLLGYFYLFPPYAKYIITTGDLLCHASIIKARIPLSTITSFEKETAFRLTHRIPFLIRHGIVVNCCGPFSWSKEIKHDQVVIFASTDFIRHLQEVTHKSSKHI